MERTVGQEVTRYMKFSGLDWPLPFFHLCGTLLRAHGKLRSNLLFRDVVTSNVDLFFLDVQSTAA